MPPSRQHQIKQGDCVGLTAKLPDNSIDLSVFSPPYDGIRDYKKDWVVDLPSLGQNLYRLTKPGGVCAVVINDSTKNYAKSLSSFKLAIDWTEKTAWRLFETCIYSRAGNPGAWWNSRFRVDHEYILIFFKGNKPKTFNKQPLMVPSKHAGKTYSGTDRLTNGNFKKIRPKTVNPLKCRGTVWQYSTSNTEGNRLKLKHPATFPDKLAEDLILCFSNKNDTVLDPMCGSGTTCVMALKNHRRTIGLEISKEYCTIAKQRLKTEITPKPVVRTRK